MYFYPVGVDSVCLFLAKFSIGKKFHPQALVLAKISLTQLVQFDKDHFKRLLHLTLLSERQFQDLSVFLGRQNKGMEGILVVKILRRNQGDGINRRNLIIQIMGSFDLVPDIWQILDQILTRVRTCIRK